MPRWHEEGELDNYVRAAQLDVDRAYLAARANNASIERLIPPPSVIRPTYTVYADDQPVRTFYEGGPVPGCEAPTLSPVAKYMSAGGYIPVPARWPTYPRFTTRRGPCCRGFLERLVNWCHGRLRCTTCQDQVADQRAR
jgi:hypothetical protein